jgi:hypothetical protein
MTQENTTSRGWHLVGLGLAGVLCVACYGLYLYVPVWLRGTPLQGLGNLVTFLGVIALLSLSERIWTRIRNRTPEDKDEPSS